MKLESWGLSFESVENSKISGFLLLSALITASDGSVNDSEIAAASDTLRHFIPDFDADEFRKLSERLVQELSSTSLESIIESVIPTLESSLDEDARKEIISIASTIAMSDGEVSPEEVATLDLISERLGIGEENRIKDADPDLLKTISSSFSTGMLSPSYEIPSEVKLGLLSLINFLGAKYPTQVRNGASFLILLSFARGMWAEVVKKMDSIDDLAEETKEILARDKQLLERYLSTVDEKDQIDFVKLAAVVQFGHDNDLLDIRGMLQFPDLAKVSAKVVMPILSMVYDNYLLASKSIPQELFSNPYLSQNRTLLKNWLIQNKEWDEKSFARGCAKLDLVGGESGLAPTSGSFFSSLFSSPKGHPAKISEMLTPGKTVLRFLDKSTDLSAHAKDHDMWIQTFLREGFFVGRKIPDQDIFGIPSKTDAPVLSVDQGYSFFNRDFLVVRLDGGVAVDLILLDVEHQAMFVVPLIVMYAVGSIEISDVQ